MNKLIITMILFLLISPTISEAKTQKIKVKINGNGSTIIQKDFNGVKISVKTPKISKNKYLRLINIGI